MGLDYLNKKTWHTGSIKNMEQVWLREQKEADKIKQQKEHQKKLLEERYNEELKKMQADAGYISKSQLERMEWMYDWQHKQNPTKISEEYLLGKKVENLPSADTAAKGQFVPMQHKEEETNQRCEDFSKLHEDPLYQIMIEQEKRKQQIRDNPLEVRRILLQKQEEEEQRSQKSLKKKHKKDKKKHKKDKKKASKEASSRGSRSRSGSAEADTKSKSSKKSKGSRKHARSSSSSSSSSSEDDARSRASRYSTSQLSSTSTIGSTKSMQSQIYEQYMIQKLGPLMVRDADGSLRPDYGLMKRLHKPNRDQQDARPMTDLEKNALRTKMQREAHELEETKNKQSKRDFAHDYEEAPKQKTGDFLAKMKQEIYKEENLGDLSDRLGAKRSSLSRLHEQNSSKV